MNTACLSARKQVTVLGINSLYGKVVSFLLKQSPIANRLVLYDEGDTGVAHDIAVIPTPCKVVVYNGEEQLRCAVKNSDVILIGDKDDCITNDDEVMRRKAAEIVRYAHAISTMAPNAIVLIAATPVNSLLPVFTEAQIGCGTFDCDKVMGVTSADTMRASTLLARHMGIDPEKAYLPVIGGSSSDTRIPLFSQSRPIMNGSKNDLRDLTRVVKMTEDDLKGMLNRGEALNKAYASVQLIDSVMSALHGQRNISEIVLSKTCLVPNVDYFSLPVILGPRGIAHRFPLPTLTERETILLDHAIKHIEIDKMIGINAISGESRSIQTPDMSEKYSELINCYDKDFIESLMEKFKIGGDCPEVCKPRVEYKLLSKVKLKLPPDSKPSEVPERTKFIEPDTPTQDGCCPLKLPCPPIPPIRGLNLIQAKHTCKSGSESRACKCFFPPVEKTLVPCNLCRSNKPCVNYDEFKTFYGEHGHCCLPISVTDEENSKSSNIIAIANAPPISSDQHTSTESYPTAIACSETSQHKTTSFSAIKTNNSIFHAVWEYPKRGVEEPEPMPMLEQQTPHASTKITSKGQEFSSQAQSNNSNPEQVKTPRSGDCEAATTPASETLPYSQALNQLEPNVHSIPQGLSSKAVIAPNPPASRTSSTEPVNLVNPNNQLTQPGKTTLQQHDSDWPFKCSTALCLDVLAPKSALDGSPIPQYKVKSNAGTPNQTSAHPSMNPEMNEEVHVEQNVHKHNQQQQQKIYNYSSGISIKTPQEMMEGINTKLQEKERAEPVLKPTHNVQLNAQAVGSIQNRVQPNCTIHEMNAAERETHNLPHMSGYLQEYCNNLASSPRIISNRSVKINYHEPNRLSQPSEQTHGQKAASGRVIMDDRRTKDENIKRRIYATLKVIENIKSESTQPLEEKCNKSGFSISQHFNEESVSDMRSSRYSNRISEDKDLENGLQNSMLDVLREKSRAINANMELQKGMRACLDKSRRKRRKDSMGIGGLIDSISPTRRQPKRLESRPKLGKSYQALRKMYGRPNHLENQGKRGGMLVTTMPESEEKSLVVVNDSKESIRLTRRIDRIKERIQEALKKIIYPSFTSSGGEPELKRIKQNNLSHKLLLRPATRRSSKSKQEFFVELRKMDPAYRPTTRIYAAKCPTRLLFDDHPSNHSTMVTFNNVVEKETARANVPTQKINEGRDFSIMREEIKNESSSFSFPEVPNFPELILKAESKIMPKDKMDSNDALLRNSKKVEPQNSSNGAFDTNEIQTYHRIRQETTVSGIPPLRGDYVKHFETKTLPRDSLLPESLRAVIRERSRNVSTPGSLKAKRFSDGRYAMTSPNRLTRKRTER